MTRRFEGKVVVITGGSDGIGLESAQLFAAEGALVYVTARRQAVLDRAVSQIGHGAVGVQGDITNLADLTKLYKRIGTTMAGSTSCSPMLACTRPFRSKRSMKPISIQCSAST